MLLLIVFKGFILSWIHLVSEKCVSGFKAQIIYVHGFGLEE
jgi:hypothetical protein